MQILLLQSLLLISVAQCCDIKWKGQNAEPVQEADIFEDRILVDWKTLFENTRCVKQITVEQKQKGEILSTTTVRKTQLRNKGGSTFQIKNSFVDCHTHKFRIERKRSPQKRRKIINQEGKILRKGD